MKKLILALILMNGFFILFLPLYGINVEIPADSGFSPPLQKAVELYLIPFLASVVYAVWKINEMKTLRVLHAVWDIIKNADHKFDKLNDPEADYYLKNGDVALNLAKKQYVCDKLGELPKPETRAIIRKFGSFDWAVEAAFLVFKFGKKLVEVVK